jgi:two-component sensor histidine kinase
MERDRAIAIGLIVNELVVNAAKHAFSDSANPTISVVLKENGAGWRLIVCDNGRGLPPDGEPSNGLGRGLIAALVRQIKGVLIRSNTPGATFQIDLPA